MQLTDCNLATSSNEEDCWIALNFYKFVNQFINFEFDSHCCSTLTWAPRQESRDFSLRNCLLTKRGWFLSCRGSLSIWSGCWVAFQLPGMTAASSKLWIILQKNWQTPNHHCKKEHTMFSNLKYVPCLWFNFSPLGDFLEDFCKYWRAGPLGTQNVVWMASRTKMEAFF